MPIPLTNKFGLSDDLKSNIQVSEFPVGRMQTAFLKTRGGGQKKYNKIFVFVQKWIPPFGLLPALREYSGEQPLLLPHSPIFNRGVGE